MQDSIATLFLKLFHILLQKRNSLNKMYLWENNGRILAKWPSFFTTKVVIRNEKKSFKPEK